MHSLVHERMKRFKAYRVLESRFAFIRSFYLEIRVDCRHEGTQTTIPTGTMSGTPTGLNDIHVSGLLSLFDEFLSKSRKAFRMKYMHDFVHEFRNE